MSTDFTLPELGENVTAGDVIRVLVSSGDIVAKDQPVLELETDKATIEVPSSVSGTVKDVRIKQGERVKVGQVVLTVDEPGAGEQKKSAKGAQPQAAPASKERTGDNAAKKQPAGAPDEGGLSQAAPGDAAGTPRATDDDERGGQKGAEDQARGTVPSGSDQSTDDRAAAGADSRPEEEPAARQKPRGEVVEISRGARGSAAQPQAEPVESEGPSPPAAPSVRRLARELGVDIGRVAGSGPDGRISPEDVQAYVRDAIESGAAGSATASAALPDPARWGDVERKPMSNIRRKTAEHLSHAWNVIPHVTQHDKADITAIEGLRKQYGGQAEKAGGKLTVTAIALKIVEAALRRFPQFNASLDTARNEIVYRKSVHIGVAVDTERGLLVPVIRDVDRKGIIQLAVELAQASEKARAGKLSLDEMQGGGFTITNLGGIGGTSFTPIVNWPEVAILGMSRGGYEPVWRTRGGQDGDRPGLPAEDSGRFEPRLMLPLSLSYDHRVIDGADAARFLRWVAEAFEQPFLMHL